MHEANPSINQIIVYISIIFIIDTAILRQKVLSLFKCLFTPKPRTELAGNLCPIRPFALIFFLVCIKIRFEISIQVPVGGLVNSQEVARPGSNSTCPGNSTIPCSTAGACDYFRIVHLPVTQWLETTRWCVLEGFLVHSLPCTTVSKPRLTFHESQTNVQAYPSLPIGFLCLSPVGSSTGISTHLPPISPFFVWFQTFLVSRPSAIHARIL